MKPDIRTTNLLNQIFGYLTVVQRAPNHPMRQCAMWVCKCVCGATTIVRADKLVSGSTKACALHGHRFPHKSSLYDQYRREYNSWSQAKARCNNPKNASYKSYGALGVTMCPEWEASFETFIRDMGPKNDVENWLERVNTYGNYEPGNCVWATQAEQLKNKRKSICITYQGQERLLYDVTRELGLDYLRIAQRLRNGWPVEEALGRSRLQRRRKILVQYDDGSLELETHDDSRRTRGAKSNFVEPDDPPETPKLLPPEPLTIPPIPVTYNARGTIKVVSDKRRVQQILRRLAHR